MVGSYRVPLDDSPFSFLYSCHFLFHSLELQNKLELKIHMFPIIQRGLSEAPCLLSEQGCIIENPWKEIHAKFGIDGVIRIHAKDYSYFPEDNLFTHFNVQISQHVPGHIYALPKIITPGFFISPEKEQPPILDFSGCLIARCLAVKEEVSYDALTQKDFAYSFRHIQNVDELQTEILWRYTQSLPTLSREEILALGVSITHLEIIRRLNS